MNLGLQISTLFMIMTIGYHQHSAILTLGMYIYIQCGNGTDSALHRSSQNGFLGIIIVYYFLLLIIII